MYGKILAMLASGAKEDRMYVKDLKHEAENNKSNSSFIKISDGRVLEMLW